MNDCVFEKVIIIGYGQIANDCIQKMNTLKKEYGYKLQYIEYENTLLSTARELCERENIEYCNITEKPELTKYFMSVKEDALVISACNSYIFPKEVVQKDNFTIINFHNALLPKYPGRNAQTWTIFGGEKESGATWHFVNEELDAGRYIIQKSTPITEDTKAYELIGEIMKVGFEAFCEIIDGILKDEYEKTQTVPLDPNRKVYKGKDIPGNGIFSLTDSADYIYLMLRSMDYGKNEVFPPAKTKIGEKNVQIVSYRKKKNEGIDGIVIEEKHIYMPLSNKEYMLKLKYRTLE